MCSYPGRSAHLCDGLIGYICLLSSHWWLYCDYYEIFRWFLGCLYLFYGCLVVDVKVNVGIWYQWLLICLFYFLELLRKVLWGLILFAIRSIPIQSCELDASNITTSAFCEDKLIWFIAGYLVDADYDRVKHWDGVLTPSGDIFC